MTREEALAGQAALRILNEWMMDRENKMKTPDKVHIMPMRKKGYVGIAWADEQHVEGYVEYIHKDALLEWAKECFRLQDSGSWYSKGAADAFSKLIDKLNSM